MEKAKYSDGFNIKMAISDAIPVLFFGFGAILLTSAMNSKIILWGALVSFVAGCGKVLWKFILAIRKKDIVFLNKQFRYMMSAGFLMMIVGGVIERRKASVTESLHMLVSFPIGILMILCVLCMIGMFVMAVKLDKTVARNNWREQIVNTVAQFFFLLSCGMVWYCMRYYPVTDRAVALAGTQTVQITSVDGGWFIDGPGDEAAFVFYPGGLVDAESYAPLLAQIAAGGIDCFLVEMPDRLAVFGINRADKIMKRYEYEHWYIGGHSLGGSMAAVYAAKHAADIDGLILLAAYSTKDLSKVSFPVVSIYGSEDGVLNLEKYASKKHNLPEDIVELCITGGNHAGFGYYGAQKGDGAATIRAEEQWRTTAEMIISVYNNTNNN